jgi:tellurite methyltransferase
MTNTSNIDWVKHFENTKNTPTSPLLLKALEYVKLKNKAIDIGGGGTLKDTRYLLSLGFETTIVDKEKLVEVAADEIKSDRLKVFVSDFADFDFPSTEYDIASAMYSLPFNRPSDFENVFYKVINSLVKDGIFCGQFFGNHDGWHNNPQITFFPKEKAMTLLASMDVIHFEEKEFDGKTADGSPKHWHVFDIIARKK